MRWGIGIVALVLVGMFLAALVPRWWAQRMGNVIDGRISLGSVLGFAAGAIGTFVAFVVARWAWSVREKRAPAVFLLVVALVLALPNLMTLWVVLGSGSAAHAGERIFDVDGPGFRGGSFVGALIGTVLFAALSYRRWQRGRERRRLDDERSERVRADRETGPGEPDRR
ncbi:MAG: hypothetical protein ACK5OX_09065 [Desertimonas sp.]